MADFVLALDQGTTSSRALLFDRGGAIRSVGQFEFPQSFPRPGWVEHDPEEIWQSQLRAARGAIEQAGITASDIAAVGITNQRETTIVWDRRTGEAIHPAIVWQSRQSSGICDALRERGLEEEIRARTGLLIDAYFSGTKIRFILDAVEGAQARADAGELCFGTVDSWLLYKLTGGRVFATEPSNASRTLVYDIHDGDWHEGLLGELGIPRAMLPEVRDSSGVFGETQAEWFGAAIPIAGIAGDQQSALFGQGCVAPGQAKNTYGTGCFLLMNTGEEAPRSQAGLVTTVAWRRAGRVEYALEGSIFVAGAAIQWLRDGLDFFDDAAESEVLARSVDDSEGVFVVPAFVGLGAPYWDEAARGTIVGLTRGTTRAHITRATLESLAYQTRDVMDAMAADSGISPATLRVDGGACQNDFLMQFQADVLGIPVERPAVLEATAKGAAALAGLGVGFWRDPSDLEASVEPATLFEPRMTAEERDARYHDWQRAVERSRAWAEADAGP
ncbi:MAG: glycerol kinase GlpK [Deltaproteobacteria bacterium]|jgi:glycerol kinase|nr:glycerol kinase GlpK [Deltaproteobacteria bacterium]